MKKGLRNPALITAVASSPQGQKAISSGLETANEAVSTSVSIVKGVFVLGALFVLVTLVLPKGLVTSVLKFGSRPCKTAATRMNAGDQG